MWAPSFDCCYNVARAGTAGSAVNHGDRYYCYTALHNYQCYDPGCLVEFAYFNYPRPTSHGSGKKIFGNCNATLCFKKSGVGTGAVELPHRRLDDF